MLRTLGFTNFLLLVFVGGTVMGLVFGILMKVFFTRDTPGGQFAIVCYAALGAALGCFIAVCAAM